MMQTHTMPQTDEPARAPERMIDQDDPTEDAVPRLVDADERDTDEDGYGYGV
jgi:hypothetical protein